MTHQYSIAEITARRRRGRLTSVVVSGAFVMGAVALGTGQASATTRSVPARQAPASAHATCGSLTVWTDATRLPAVKDYARTHPCVHLTTTVFGYTGTELQTKIGLFNKEGSGWPDILWDPATPDAGWLDSTQYHYAAVLNHGLVSKSKLNQWASHSLAVCTSGSNIYCLRNDIAANVLWYNAPLMKKFGYKVPTTWAQYAKIGAEVAKQHPGYVIGTIGDAYADSVYFWGSGCPANRIVGTMKIEVNTTSPNCTRVAKLVDPLIKNGTLSTMSVTSSDFAKKYGDTNHVLMEIGATWYGGYIFQPDFKPPKGTWAAADPLTWPNFHYTGDVGGGIWEVSSHASSATQKLAASMAYWLTSSPVYQATAPT